MQAVTLSGLVPSLRRSPEICCLYGNTGNLFAWEGLHFPGCTFPFHIFRSCRGAPEKYRKQASPLCKENRNSPLLPLPPSILITSPFFSTLCVGRKTLNNLARFPPKWEGSLFLGMQRVKAIAGQFWPQGGRVLRHLRAATGLIPALPLFSPYPPTSLQSLHPVLSVRVGLSRLSPAQEASLRPGVPDPGSGTGRPRREESAHPCSRPPSPGGRACMGTVCGAQAAASGREPIPTWHRARPAPLPQLQRGHSRSGGFGCRAQRPAPGLGLGVTGSRG